MNRIKEIPVKNWLGESPIIKYFSTSKSHQMALFASTGMLFVIVTYIWFISFGTWTKWHATTDYYDQLASAFAHGSLSLEKEADPALLLLTNPYNPGEREGINYPLDFSLYKGKYYLYFGPAPALLLAIFKLLDPGKIGDQYLVFISIVGIFIFQSLLIIEIQKQFFHNIPDWILPTCIIFSGLISPFIWILTEGRVYEAASTSGQFFFLAGFYFNIRALKKETALPGEFLIGSTLWAFSLGSRITQILPIGFLTLMIFFLSVRTYFKTKSISKAIYSIASLGLPLAIGAGVLAWYNWARFGSVFETGYSYQLSTPDLQRYGPKLFLPVYILPNLYDYFAAPPKIIGQFPFLQPVRGRGNLLFPFLALPKVYYTRAMTGILLSTPFTFFAGVSVISILFPRMGMGGQEGLGNDTYLLKWIVFALLGSFLFGLIPIASFFWVVTRYFVDFSPSLVILSIIGFWLGYRFLNRWPIARKVYILAGVALMLASVVVSNLLVLSIRTPNYQAWNPVLWNQLTRLFSW